VRLDAAWIERTQARLERAYRRALHAAVKTGTPADEQSRELAIQVLTRISKRAVLLGWAAPQILNPEFDVRIVGNTVTWARLA
jgi:hypothetical protein